MEHRFTEALNTIREIFALPSVERGDSNLMAICHKCPHIRLPDVKSIIEHWQDTSHLHPITVRFRYRSGEGTDFKSLVQILSTSANAVNMERSWIVLEVSSYKRSRWLG